MAVDIGLEWLILCSEVTLTTLHQLIPSISCDKKKMVFEKKDLKLYKNRLHLENTESGLQNVENEEKKRF